jgi:hypothetical protein
MFMSIGHVYEGLQWAGVASLVAIVSFGVLPLFRKPFDPSGSVSQSWGETERTHRTMGVVLTVFGAGFSAFVIGWLVPTYHVAPFMYYITAAAYLGLLAVGWVRIVERPAEHPVHHPHFVGGVAGATGIALYYAAALLAHPALPPVSRHLTIIAFAYSVCWPLFFLKRIRNYFLILECLFVLLFVLVVLSLTLGW